jgi:hypothetical protein
VRTSIRKARISPGSQPKRKATAVQRGRRCCRLFGKDLISGLDQDVHVLGLEYDIWIEPFDDVIKARDGHAAFVASSISTRAKERQLHDAIFREERGDPLAVWDFCEASAKSVFIR